MKVLFLILSMLVVTNTAFSQAALKQGTTSLGGSISYLSSEQEISRYTIKETHFQFSPQFSKFIMDNFEIGGLFSYQRTKSEQTGGPYNFSGESNTIGLGVVANFYLPLKETMAAFLGAGGTLTVNPDYAENKLFIFFGQAGINIYLTDYAAVNIKGQYSIIRYSESDTKGSTFLIGAGMTYYLLD